MTSVGKGGRGLIAAGTWLIVSPRKNGGRLAECVPTISEENLTGPPMQPHLPDEDDGGDDNARAHSGHAKKMTASKRPLLTKGCARTVELQLRSLLSKELNPLCSSVSDCSLGSWRARRTSM